MDRDNNLIKDTYLNLSQPAAFLGADKIHQTLKKREHNKPGIHKIRKWLQNQDDYSLLKPVRRHFQRARVIVSGQNEQLDVDLMDMQSLNKKNNKVKFLLTAVDVFSRIAYVLPLKDKTGKSVEKALSEIIKKAKVRKVRSDAGSEFKNKLVKKLLDDNNIYHHVALNDDIKANYVERFNRTLKMMIFRYLTKNKTDRYIDVLPKLVESYNSTPHRSLGNIAPNDVNKENEADLFAYMYLKPKRKDNSKGSLDKKNKSERKKKII